MTRDEIKTAVLRILGGIAPEADLSALDPDANVREELDLDSMDVLNVVIALDHDLHVPIPEVDYPKLTTLNGYIAYLEPFLNQRGPDRTG